MIEWGRVPWSLWVWVGIAWVVMVEFIVRVAGDSEMSHVAARFVSLSLTVALLLAWDFYMLKGVRWLWIATVIFLVLSLVIDLATASGTWYWDLAGLVQLGLLLLPPTRRFFASAGSPATDVNT